MSSAERPIVIATRGSALALAQANMVLAQCRKAFPRLAFEIKIIKTTGDKIQKSSVAKTDPSLPKGLFTKELEVALLKNKADLAVHSLKDLPTELPAGLMLGAVGKRADARDALIYRDAEFLAQSAADKNPSEWAPGHSERRGFHPGLGVEDLPHGAIVATGSPRRQAQLLARNPKLKVVDVRGNVVTRMQKLADRAEFDAIVLAVAGLNRLNFLITEQGRLEGDAVPDGLLATVLPPEVMLPCVGQGAIGIEVRRDDERIATLCAALNHFNTMQAVTAERTFLSCMGGGCQAPMAAFAEVNGDHLVIRALFFDQQQVIRAEGKMRVNEPVELGTQVADEIKKNGAAVPCQAA